MTARFGTVAMLLLLGASLAAQPLESPQEIPALLQELQAYRQKNDLVGEAVTLLRLGVAETRLGDIDNGRRSLTDAARKMRAANDAMGTWLAHFALAHVESGVGRPKEAIAQIEKAFAVMDDASRSGTLFSPRALLIVAGQPPEVIDSLDSDRELVSRTTLEEHAQPVTHALYGSLLTQAGQLEMAEEELNKASAGSKGRYDAPISAHFGDLRFRQQRYDEARTHYQKAIRELADGSLLPLLDGPSVLAGVYDALAQVEIAAGDPEAARAWNAKALELARPAGGPGATPDAVVPGTDAELRDALKVAEAMNNLARQAAIEVRLGRLQSTNGNYGSAASHFERSLQLYGSLDDPPAETAAWGDLCVVYIQMKNYAAVQNVLERARARIGNKSEVGDAMLAFLETALRFVEGRATVDEFKARLDRYSLQVPAEDDAFGSLRRFLGDLATAVETTDLSQLQIPAQSTVFAGTLMSLAAGVQRFQNEDFAGARTIWEEAFGKNPSHHDRAALGLMIGYSYFLEGNVEQASRWLAEGTTIVEAGMDDLLSDDMIMGYLGDQRMFYDALIESLVASGKIELSFEAAERARARAFLRLLGNRRLPPPTGREIAVVREAEELRRKIDNWDNDPQPRTTLADLRRQYAGVLSRVQVIAREQESLTSVPPQQLEVIRRELPEDTTLLSYFVTSMGIHAWILDKESLEHVRLGGDESLLRRISCWAFELSRPRSASPEAGNDCGVAPADAAEAYAALIAPLRVKLSNKRLMIVPHGELHYVPFAALYDSTLGRYLIDDYPITYVPSASAIRFLREKESPVAGRALVLGEPVASNLPGASREARDVAAKFRTTAKLGNEALESELLKLGGKVDLVHIAAHGTYDPVSPLFSAIHLAAGKGENGQLTVDEIQSELDLSGVNLVVLSACRSGVGKRSGGDEIIGLTRSILYAGSPGVLSTLWNISDAVTPVLIEKFYDHLLAGATAADALRAAQIELRRDPKMKDPRYWGAFFLTGDPQGNWKRPAS